MESSRSFYRAGLLALGIFGVLNLGVVALSRNTVPRQIARSIETTPGLNFLALGNSLMEAGFNASAFEADGNTRRAGLVALNAGMGSSYPVEHLLLLRRAFLKRSGLRYILYGFFDLQLMDPPSTALHELIGNRAMLYYFEPNVAADYYQWPLLDRLTFHLTRLVPAIQERGTIWAKVEKFRRRLDAVGMPVQQSNQFGRARDFALLEAANATQFAQDCDQAVSAHRDLSRPVGDMIRLSRQHGARILMVEMPMSASHIGRYYSTPAWQRYRAYLKDLLAGQGADYIVAGDWIRDERLFADHLHLSPQGSVVFSRQLALAPGVVPL